MGYFVGLPLGGTAEKDCQVRFGKNMTFQVETRAPHLPGRMGFAKRHTAYMAPCGYRLDLYVGRSAGMFCSHCPRNSRPGDIADCNPRTG